MAAPYVEQNAAKRGKIVTFYSYKGGTGRSLVVANVAWILFTQGKRVLVVDWDLEAPGLHRYFHPFLQDKELAASPGLIDFFANFAEGARQPHSESAVQDNTWFQGYASVAPYAYSLCWPGWPAPSNPKSRWPFSTDGGSLDFIPSGQQGPSYGIKVTAFDWAGFYEKLGGGIFLETAKKQLRQDYDYVLIDSRTGISDSSGICTVQMPDELVVCFTLNRQSMYGAAAAAQSVLDQRTSDSGSAKLKIWPVPMRVEMTAEKERLESAQLLARSQFNSFLSHLTPVEQDAYWRDTFIPYQPYYAYEEILAPFAESPTRPGPLMAGIAKLVRYLGGDSDFVTPMDEISRREGLKSFTARCASDCIKELMSMAPEYENIRQQMSAGRQRTQLMNALVSRAQLLAGSAGAAEVAEQIWKQQTDGSRVIGLALAANEPRRTQIEMALPGIASSRSAFEQYHALLLTRKLLPLLETTAVEQLRNSLNGQVGKTITDSDSSRAVLANELLAQLPKSASARDWTAQPNLHALVFGLVKFDVVHVEPSNPVIRYADRSEQHGPYLGTRRDHKIELPRVFRIGRTLVTNEIFREFTRDGGYQRKEFWPESPNRRYPYLTDDDKSLGPASWPSSEGFRSGKDQHPVCGICFYEIQAFIRWCNFAWRAESDWSWALPSEDIWEFAARSETGLVYPWGDAFDATKCNSAEGGLDTTTEVAAHPGGASRIGCLDLAGNLWEFVEAADNTKNQCVLRGGSYKNNLYEIRSYLRLIGVPKRLRAPDFGFRLAQVRSL